jgi:hypothetical protein
MSLSPQTSPPADADARRAVQPVTVYTLDKLPPVDMALYARARETLETVETALLQLRGSARRVGGHLA